MNTSRLDEYCNDTRPPTQLQSIYRIAKDTDQHQQYYDAAGCTSLEGYSILELHNNLLVGFFILERRTKGIATRNSHIGCAIV